MKKSSNLNTKSLVVEAYDIYGFLCFGYDCQIKEIYILCACTLSEHDKDLTLAKTKLGKILGRSEDM